MKLSKRWPTTLICVAGSFCCGLYFANASWLASPGGRGVPRVIAQRGVAQTYYSERATDDSCTARLIHTPIHTLIDNTLPSIAAAIDAGADIVEIDIRATKDGQFVLFHDDGLGCRTDGSGQISEHSASEMKALDVGYGYTADEGKSFPLRGKGIGLMPTLAEVLQTYPNHPFLVQIKDADPAVADSLTTYLKTNRLEISRRLTFFGSEEPLRRLHEIFPFVRIWSAKSSSKCFIGYVETGWFGHVPRICDDAAIIVPINQAFILWGWPNRFLDRMRKDRTEVMLIGSVDWSNRQFTRLDNLEELSRIRRRFDGSVWTDQVRVIGPYVRGCKKRRTSQIQSCTCGRSKFLAISNFQIQSGLPGRWIQKGNHGPAQWVRDISGRPRTLCYTTAIKS